jgi:hypothetical protein
LLLTRTSAPYLARQGVEMSVAHDAEYWDIHRARRCGQYPI